MLRRALFALAVTAAPVNVPPAPAGTPVIETVFERVAPADGGTRTQDRAVVLIHGLRAHPFSARNTRTAFLHDWQRADSTMVAELVAHADVYSFAYGQNGSIADVARSPGFAAAIASVADAGYTEIVLVGHSSGAVISREFVEEFPDAGVTKVVQVSPPNAGSYLIHLTPDFHGTQSAFLNSILPQGRVAPLERERRVPDAIEMVVVIGDGFGVGDLAVRDEFQWPPDLQAQGIPALQLRTTHFTAMRSRRIVRELVKLVTEPQPRWTAEQVKAAREDMVENPFERAGTSVETTDPLDRGAD